MDIELQPLDRHFADFICRQAGTRSEMLRLCASLLSHAVGQGHVCLDLAAVAGREITLDGLALQVSALEDLRAELPKMKTVGAPGELSPLVLDAADRLYLYRYWKYERDLAEVLLTKAATPSDGLDPALLQDGLRRLFAGGGGEGTDWQKVAALAAVRKRLCVISGGPGTGKTSTVVKILALLLEQTRGKPLRIALAAPTGKSAARLKESISSMVERIDSPAEIRLQIPHEVSTVHRLLGPVAGSVRFRHGEENPLPQDVVIVDEASMVALPLMAKLARALKPAARLILLGDRDQLASVEAGAVLGDICAGGEVFSAPFAELVARQDAVVPFLTPGTPLPPLADALVILKKTYRFGAHSGIGAVARAVNEGDGAEALSRLKDPESRDTLWNPLPPPEGLKRDIAPLVAAGYASFLTAPTVEEALVRFDAFRILCALRRGPYGVAGLNALVEEILAEKGWINPRQRWYRGRPVLVTQNDYSLKLFNGDVGIVFPDPESGGAPRVFFPSAEGGIRKVSPVRLPPHETVYAMTVHKSQGSEFDQVLMLLPGHDSAALTRELIYTGLTRARKGIEIWAEEAVFLAAAARRTQRHSGLRERICSSPGARETSGPPMKGDRSCWAP